MLIEVIYMDKIRLLIADSDERFTDYIVSSLKIYNEIEIIAVENNGLDALQRIKHGHVDALVFDLLLPGLDGISLLRSVNELKNPPATLCCTRFYSDIAMEVLRSFGASYLIYKPLEAHALYTAVLASIVTLKRMKNIERAVISSCKDTDHSRAYIRNFIISCGIPSKLIGSTYLTEAVMLALHDAMLIKNLSKGLYLEVARIMSTTPSCIERCIRNAISSAYIAHKLPASFLQCPSNKEFLRYILQNLNL